jgi:hypothetical protein
MMKRRRFKQNTSFTDRLISFSQELRAKAALLGPGSEKDQLLEKARQADSVARDDLALSLRPPK